MTKELTEDAFRGALRVLRQPSFQSGRRALNANAHFFDLIVVGWMCVCVCVWQVTSLQLRLHDGTRLVAKFNHTHTVGDIRQFINRCVEFALSRSLLSPLVVLVLNFEWCCASPMGCCVPALGTTSLWRSRSINANSLY